MPLLPALRVDLDFMPSPVPERPGLLIRDPFHYSDATLIIPPALVQVLELFDGRHSELDLRERLVRLTGDLQVGELERHLIDTLSSAGFLLDESYQLLRDNCHAGFTAASVREAAHAGTAYPSELDPLNTTMREWTTPAADGAPTGSDRVIGIAAPHVSPEGGWQSYRDAYAALNGDHSGKTFVILGTSHYGRPDRFGLTRKPFRTPFGETTNPVDMVDTLTKNAGQAIEMEDYCHSFEHSIEFQVVFLQHRYGPSVRVLPILCGSFGLSFRRGGLPERDDNVARFLGALGELAAREGDRLCWVLGVDMAHMGRRYGDGFSARARDDRMSAVELRDRDRIDRVSSGDAEGFWERVRENDDDLKWCGSSPLYTFLRAAPGARGTLDRYEQWNIDDESIVSFAAMRFTAP